MLLGMIDWLQRSIGPRNVPETTQHHKHYVFHFSSVPVHSGIVITAAPIDNL